jgi:curved DNA-binding protein
MPTTYHDYYKTLGVKRDASQEEIKKAFHRLARRYHPDRSKQPDAEQRFKEINEAYEVLGDPEKRQRYDALGADWKAGQKFTPPPGWESIFDLGTGRRGGRRGSFDFSDFFETLFGGGAQRAGAGGFGGFGGAEGQARSPQWSPPRGQDIETELTITLEEAHRGTKRAFELRRAIAGEEPGTRRYEVRIPTGTGDGDRLRLSGQGGAVAGGATGDLFVRVRVAPHPTFTVSGRDLSAEIALAPWEAALGAQLPVQTLDGEVSLKIPPGTRSGRTFRLRAQGLARMGGGRGDLLLAVRIDVPEELTDRERELFEELRRVSPFRPRGA